jgi:hypothetical protein
MQGAQPGDDMIDHDLGRTVAEIAQDGEHQGVRVVLCQEAGAVHLVHVHRV